jgi:uncharacterized Ntn-hydrolase superfamily protein
VTFSIAARAEDAWGVAVASTFLAVGSVVPAVRPGVGAVATQAMARVAYLDEVLTALGAGGTLPEALDRAVAADEGREHRQVGVVGPGGAATWTGSACVSWAGGVSGGDATSAYAIQGNILTGPEVVEAMERAWHDGAGRRLDERLVAVLLAGDAAGGDARGRQSAALLVRVDDHPSAPRELARLHDLATLYFGTPEGVRPLEGDLADEVRDRLAAEGYRGADLAASLEAWMGAVNLENRHTADGIDARVLAVLRDPDAALTDS